MLVILQVARSDNLSQVVSSDNLSQVSSDRSDGTQDNKVVVLKHLPTINTFYTMYTGKQP